MASTIATGVESCALCKHTIVIIQRIVDDISLAVNSAVLICVISYLFVFQIVELIEELTRLSLVDLLVIEH